MSTTDPTILNQLADRFIKAAAQAGYAIGEDHKPEIMETIDSLENAWQDKIVTDIANGLPSGGIKTAEFGGFKNALLSSEPQMDQATNDLLSAGYDKLLAILKKIGTPTA